MLAEEELSYKVRGAIYEVYNQLGFGYLEKIYERALSHELRACSIDVQCQVPLSVRYKDIVVGEYFVDVIVEKRILLELKGTTSDLEGRRSSTSQLSHGEWLAGGNAGQLHLSQGSDPTPGTISTTKCPWVPWVPWLSPVDAAQLHIPQGPNPTPGTVNTTKTSVGSVDSVAISLRPPLWPAAELSSTARV